MSPQADKLVDINTGMSMDDVSEFIDSMPDEVLSRLQFSVPWQFDSESGASKKDEDGFPISPMSDHANTFSYYQLQCWKKFIENPQIRTATTDYMGRMTGDGFGMVAEIPEIQGVMDQVIYDPRNKLYNAITKYAGRSYIEGELFLQLTCHKDGFIEVDFRDPGTLKAGSGKGSESGIVFHPSKDTFPLYYIFEDGGGTEVIPSINIAYFPNLAKVDLQDKPFLRSDLKGAMTRTRGFGKIGGFYKFIVSWDRGLVTKRNLSHLRTTLEWINHYENLKKYEIDHKKSSGAYLWVITIEDPKSFRAWISLSDEERKKTGIMAKKTPGGTLVLPPGMKMTVVNPQLPKISDTDTDILHMVSAGLNQPEDMMMGSSSQTYGGVKASRGPLADRISDERAFFSRFLRYDFWGGIFHLRSVLDPKFKNEYKVDRAIDFEKKTKEPIIKKVLKKAYDLIEINFPVSEMEDLESRSKALLGVKHGSLKKTAGLPTSTLVKRLGFGGSYRQLRLESALEDELFPELQPEVDQESQQEIEEGETPKTGKKKKPKKVDEE